MATILVVDDRPKNREFLVTLLGYREHRVLESKDGAEALAIVRAERPDVVISDILMPVMDGYELMRNIRESPDLAGIPVIFWTAHYLEREARALAQSSGAFDILTKPCEPEEVLRIVDRALGGSAAPGPTPGDFHQRHLRLLTNKLSRKTDEAYWTQLRLQALVEAIHQLSMETDPEQLLEFACREAREMIGSASSIIGIPSTDNSGDEFWCIRGAEARLDREFCNALRISDLVRAMIAKQAPVRFPAPGQKGPFDIAWPMKYQVESLLSVPIVSPKRSYGWFFFINKVGVTAFTDEDERLAQAFAAEVALSYESLRLCEQVTRLNSELTRVNAELRQCSYIAVHQLQEPLRSVQGFAQLLVSRYRGQLGADADEFLDFVQGGVHRMRSLIRDFGEYAQLAHAAEPADRIVSLAQVAGAAVEAVHQTIKLADAVVTIDELPFVRGSALQLQQVFDHLITNAVKFRSPERPTIRIKTENRERFHVISVQDNGIGIAPQHQERIFNIFERLQPDAEGTGIGLALSRKIVELHGGRLWVESSVGKGSTFRFTLPVLPPESGMESRNGKESGMGGDHGHDHGR